MDPAIHGNRPIKSVQQQETVQPERRLLMKLKGNPAELKAAKAELQAKKAELNRVEQDAEMQMSKLVESSFLQSQLPANQLSESDMFFSHIDPDELEQQDQVAEIQYQALTDMQKIGRQEEEVDVEIMKNQAETTHAEEVTLWDHATDIIGMEGTTLVSALATLGAGAAAVLTAPAIIGVTLAVAATGVATNEAVKMFNRHLSHTGSKEHGKVIQQAVERAEGKTQEAKAANAIVIKNLDECTEKIGNAEKILANLAQQMKGTTGELRQHYEGLIKLHEDVKDTQIKKKKHLLEANTNSEEALKILRGQEKLLRALQKMELPKSITEDSLKQFMTELKTQIINIRAEGDKAHDATLKSLQAMGTALQVSDAPIYDQINQLTAQTALLINRAEQAEGQVGQLQKENTDLKNINADTKEKAKITDNKLEDVETDLKIAKRANELRQEEFQFGGGSALYGIGVGGAMTIGSAFLLGPASLAFVASASLGTMGSAAVAHYVRAMKRANAHLAEKKQMAFGEAALANTQSKHAINSFGINAKYTEGTGYLKGIGNTALSWMGRSQIQSSHQGLLTLRLGSEETLEDETFELMDTSSTFDFIFDTAHVEAQQIGAMGAEQQGKLSAHLTTMVNKGLLAPEKVLEILNSLKSVNVSGANVVMIKGDSIHMKNLIRQCNLMIQKGQLPPQ